jgi:hypothetical protein
VRVRTDEPNRLWLVVPDRDGDGEAERVTWTWSSGGGLMRQLNDGTAEQVLDQVASLSLDWQNTTRTVAYPETETLGSEHVLTQTVTDSASAFEITSSTTAGQAVNVPGGSEDRYVVTSVQLRLNQKSGSGGWVRVDLYAVDSSSEPTGPVLDSAWLDTAVLGGSYDWYDFTFEGGVGFDGDEQMAFVVSRSSDGPDGASVPPSSLGGRTYLQYEHTSADGRDRLVGSAGGSYSATVNSEYRHIISGREVLSATAHTVSWAMPTGLTLRLRTASGATLDRHVRLHNTPAPQTHQWHYLDFENDPTQLDRNGDGIEDADLVAGGVINGLLGGSWSADQRLAVGGLSTWSGPMEVVADLHDPVPAEGLAGLRVNLRSGITVAELDLELERQPGHTQTLGVYLRDSLSSRSLQHTVPDLPPGNCRLRVIDDPDARLLAIEVNGQWIGPLSYTRSGDLSDSGIELYGDGTVDRLIVIAGVDP